MRADDLPLPAWVHVPGTGSRPDSATLERACLLALSPTRHETAAQNTAWNYGLHLFNNGFYWECHEVLETVWMKAEPNSRERHLVQAIIHLANARLKEEMNRRPASLKLYAMAEDSLRRINTPDGARYFMGLDLSAVSHLARQAFETGETDNLQLNMQYIT